MAHGTNMPRLTPIEPPYDPEIATLLERMMGGPAIPPLKLFRTLAHNPTLLDKFRGVGTYLLNFGTLDPRDREIVIHRTCARCGSEYEWGVHALFYGGRIGLSQNEIEATVPCVRDDSVLSDRQKLLIRLVDQLHETSQVSDELWDDLQAGWTPAQLVELLYLVGQYHTVSYLTNALRVALEERAPRFPQPRLPDRI